MTIFLIGPLAWAQKEARELAFSDWGVNVEPSVVIRAFSKEAVRDFIGTMDFTEKPIDPSLGILTKEVGINELAWSEVQKRNKIPVQWGSVGDFR